MAGLERLLQLFSAEGQRAADVATALCGLVIWGGKLGELEEHPLLGADGAQLVDGGDGVPRTYTVPLRIWLERLQRAFDVGAFDRMTPAEIVDRILLPPGAAP